MFYWTVCRVFLPVLSDFIVASALNEKCDSLEEKAKKSHILNKWYTSFKNGFSLWILLYIKLHTGSFHSLRLS